MIVTGWPEQLEEEAESLNGEVTVAPLAGALTLGLPEELPPTVIGTSVTQTAPLLPQAFTWIVCPPTAALADFCRYVPLWLVVVVLLSSE